MDFSKPESALLILGHGSTENPDSSDPTWKIADSIEQTGKFAAVHCSFWKEEPSFRQIWPMIEQDEIYVVPNFISEGYFTRQVLPRELELDGHTTKRGEKTIHYCDPVGIHSRMTNLLTKRASEILDSGIDPKETSLIIVGHGTNLNKKSTEAIRTQVDAIIASSAPFAEVHDAYMEEAPFIADWQTMTSTPNVVVVPFFISDGLHSYQDIPVMLGIESEPTEAASQRDVFRNNPYTVNGRTLYYSSAIGTDPSLAEVIIDQVAYFDEHYRNDAG
ncbi:MAG: cobalamin biosynthesis protein CbiX [Verrucomicrobiales bacterium]|nr:cobalamin biosynthesis protein CbiX [Verrucomicrobiales bacterium]